MQCSGSHPSPFSWFMPLTRHVARPSHVWSVNSRRVAGSARSHCAVNTHSSTGGSPRPRQAQGRQAGKAAFALRGFRGDFLRHSFTHNTTEMKRRLDGRTASFDLSNITTCRRNLTLGRRKYRAIHHAAVRLEFRNIQE